MIGFLIWVVALQIGATVFVTVMMAHAVLFPERSQ